MGEWIRAAKVQDVPEGEGVVSEVAGKSIAIFKVSGELFAIANVCPHRGGPLGEGELDQSVVTCPWHGWQFDVCSGKNPENEKVCVATFPIQIQDDNVMVEVN